VSERWEIAAGDPGVGQSLGDLWRHRRLVPFIGGRALRRITRRTVLGWLWLFINPLLPLTLRVVIFGMLLQVPSEGLPYPLFLIAGSMLWDTFAASLLWGARSLEMNRHLTEQIYVPRSLLPLGNVVPALLDFAITGAVFLAVLAYYTISDGHWYLAPGPQLVWAAASVALMFGFALSVSLFTSVWGETWQDTRLGLTQLMGVWYLLTPVLYPLSAVPEPYRGWMLINPLAIVLETFKWGLFGIGELRPQAFAWTAGAVLVIMLLGLVYSIRTEAVAINER
jgi:homopolymeric O-antigen transport system permease protein